MNLLAYLFHSRFVCNIFAILFWVLTLSLYFSYSVSCLKKLWSRVKCWPLENLFKGNATKEILYFLLSSSPWIIHALMPSSGTDACEYYGGGRDLLLNVITWKDLIVSGDNSYLHHPSQHGMIYYWMQSSAYMINKMISVALKFELPFVMQTKLVTLFLTISTVVLGWHLARIKLNRFNVFLLISMLGLFSYLPVYNLEQGGRDIFILYTILLIIYVFETVNKRIEPLLKRNLYIFFFLGIIFSNSHGLAIIWFPILVTTLFISYPKRILRYGLIIMIFGFIIGSWHVLYKYLLGNISIGDSWESNIPVPLKEIITNYAIDRGYYNASFWGVLQIQPFALDKVSLVIGFISSAVLVFLYLVKRLKRENFYLVSISIMILGMFFMLSGIINFFLDQVGIEIRDFRVLEMANINPRYSAILCLTCFVLIILLINASISYFRKSREISMHNFNKVRRCKNVVFLITLSGVISLTIYDFKYSLTVGYNALMLEHYMVKEAKRLSEGKDCKWLTDDKLARFVLNGENIYSSKYYVLLIPPDSTNEIISDLEVLNTKCGVYQCWYYLVKKSPENARWRKLFPYSHDGSFYVNDDSN